MARKQTPSRARLSVPMSPIPAASGATVMTPPPQGEAGGRRGEPTPPTVFKPMAPRPASTTSRKLPWIIAAGIVLLIVPGWFGGQRLLANRARPERNAALLRGIQLWQQGQATSAVPEFNTAARAMPRSALPHIYLARLARERGDLNAAVAEATTAARLEPNNALALREVGSVLLARGELDGARRFFLRSLRANPGDKIAMGWLACTLHRLGDEDASARWSTRAGPGAWSACLQ